MSMSEDKEKESREKLTDKLKEIIKSEDLSNILDSVRQQIASYFNTRPVEITEAQAKEFALYLFELWCLFAAKPSYDPYQELERLLHLLEDIGSQILDAEERKHLLINKLRDAGGEWSEIAPLIVPRFDELNNYWKNEVQEQLRKDNNRFNSKHKIPRKHLRPKVKVRSQKAQKKRPQRKG